MTCCGPADLSGWSPPTLAADTPWKSRVDRLMPRSGLAVLLYFAGVVALLNVGQLMPRRWDLLTVAAGMLAAGAWCTLNFWRCRHAHCLITGPGWLGLAALTLIEAGLGHSVIGGDEGLVFAAVLGAGLIFECGWRLARGSNALT
jgi:hypothetical protein